MINKLIYFIVPVLFASCSEYQEKNQDECTQYACPVHPDHTSTAADACPECNMEMQIISDSARDHTEIKSACCDKHSKHP